MKQVYISYNPSSVDGAVAAVLTFIGVFHKYLGDVNIKYLPLIVGERKPLLPVGAEVIIIDYSPSRVSRIWSHLMETSGLVTFINNRWSKLGMDSFLAQNFPHCITADDPHSGLAKLVYDHFGLDDVCNVATHFPDSEPGDERRLILTLVYIWKLTGTPAPQVVPAEASVFYDHYVRAVAGLNPLTVL